MAYYEQISLRDGSTYPAVEEIDRDNVGIRIRSYGSSKTYLIPVKAVADRIPAKIEKITPAYEECEQLINSFGLTPTSRTKDDIRYQLTDKLGVIIAKKKSYYEVRLIRTDLKQDLAMYINLAQLYRIELLLQRIRANQ